MGSYAEQSTQLKGGCLNSSKQILFFQVVNRGRNDKLDSGGLTINNEKKNPNNIRVGIKIYLKNNLIGYPDIKIKKTAIKKIRSAVDKLNGNTNKKMRMIGKSIYKKRCENLKISCLYITKLRHKNKIKLYFANSDG